MLKSIFKSRNLLTLLITIFVFGLIFILSYFGVFYSLDKKFQDFSYLFISPNVSKDLIIVEIDDKTFGDLGYPLDRKLYVPFIENLTKAGVSVIAFDLIFEDKSNSLESDLEFAKIIKKSNNVVFGLSTQEGKKLGDMILKKPYELFENTFLSSGFLRPNIDKKTNIIYSIIPDYIFDGGINAEHFSIAILKAYYSYMYKKDYISNNYGIKNDFFYITPEIKVPIAQKNNNTFRFKQSKENELLLNYADRNNFTKLSFVDVYDQNKFKKLLNNIDFKDKIVIVGTTAKGIKDVFNTPSGIEYGVYVHANMINTVLTKSFLVYFDKNIEWILILLLVIVSVYFNLSRSGFILIFSNVILIILFWIIFPIFVLFFTNLVINYTIELIFSLIFSLTLSNIIKFVIENESKLKLNKALSEYVSRDIADEILYGSGKINLNGEEKEVVIFFSDIVGFTSISEKFTPKELVSFLREYLTKMSDLIMDERGFVNKYEGDSILALWGVFGSDIDLSYKACISAIKQQRLLKELNKKWKETGFDEVNIRIGIHLGNAIIGNIGSDGKKIEFTALGDNVNLASRLEGVNKYYQTNICVSEDIYNNTSGLFEFRYLDKIKVKGKEITVNIYELLEEKGKITEMKKDIISKFQNAISMYLKRDFAEAMNIFINLEKFGDGPSSTYIDRCEKYISNPPDENWDGIWTMEDK